MSAPPREVELITGQLLVLDAGARHAVESVDESAFLLTIAWPGERAGRP